MQPGMGAFVHAPHAPHAKPRILVAENAGRRSAALPAVAADEKSLAQLVDTQGFISTPCRTRTYNPLIKSQMLCRLS